MVERLNNKTILITGAANGQGEYESKLFAQEGASIILCDIDLERCEHTADIINSLGGKAISCLLDVSKESDWISAIEMSLETFGSLNVLVNNAGIYSRTPIVKSSLKEFQKILNVNLNGVFLGTKHSIPAMIKSGGGSIINISSTAGIVGNTGSGAYGASKGAVRSFTKYTAIQHAKDNIRANSVHPGPIDTEMISENLSSSEGRALSESKIPLGRIGSTEDVALGVLFLASDESSFVTGAELVIDGGLTAH